ENLRRTAIKPLRIVDDDDQRPIVSHLGKQSEYSEAEKERVRGKPGGQAKRGADRLPVGRGEAVQAPEHRRAQLVKPGIGELHLRFDTRGVLDAAASVRADEILEQEGLTDPRLTADDERGAHPFMEPSDEMSEVCSLLAAAPQKRLASAPHLGRILLNAEIRAGLSAPGPGPTVDLPREACMGSPSPEDLGAPPVPPGAGGGCPPAPGDGGDAAYAVTSRW